MSEEKEIEPIKEGFKANLKKNLPGILMGSISTLGVSLIILIITLSINSGKDKYKENKDEHADLARGLMQYSDKAKEDSKSYTDSKFDSILTIYKDIKSTLEEIKGDYKAMNTYILNHKVVFMERPVDTAKYIVFYLPKK
jgi:hypothetical protein